MTMSDEIRVLDAEWERDGPDLTRVRTRVFVDEQQVPPELEIDDLDPICRHAKAITADGRIIATGRLLPDGHIGRMCVLPEYRGQGIGSRILQQLIRHARKAGMEQLILNAQVSAIDFYRRHGFAVSSEEFIEAGIPHREMRMSLGPDNH